MLTVLAEIGLLAAVKVVFDDSDRAAVVALDCVLRKYLGLLFCFCDEKLNCIDVLAALYLPIPFHICS